MFRVCVCVCVCVLKGRRGGSWRDGHQSIGPSIDAVKKVKIDHCTTVESIREAQSSTVITTDTVACVAHSIHSFAFTFVSSFIDSVLSWDPDFAPVAIEQPRNLRLLMKKKGSH